MGIKLGRMVLYSLMSTLDLTADAHLLRHGYNRRRTHIDRFLARLDFSYQGLAVLATETSTDVWTITTYPGVAVSTADSSDEYSEDYIFYGGQTYTVTGSLATALTSAGYTVS